MSNPKKDFKHFRPSHLGTQPRTVVEIKENKCRILQGSMPKSFKLKVSKRILSEVLL